jgi:hypothetical protein
MPMERMQSPAYQVLGTSSRRLLAYVEQEIAKQGGHATLYNDQLEAIGSRKVYLAGLSELNALGLLKVMRCPKKHLIGYSGPLAQHHDAEAGDDRQRRCEDAAYAAAGDAAATVSGFEPRMTDAEQSAIIEFERNGLSTMLLLFAASRELATEAATDARYIEAAAASCCNSKKSVSSPREPTVPPATLRLSHQ